MGTSRSHHAASAGDRVPGREAMKALASSYMEAGAGGVDAYPAVETKAAALLHSLVRNHALVDGNERLAWLAPVVVLALNGRAVRLSDDEAFELVMEASQGRLDVAEIARRPG